MKSSQITSKFGITRPRTTKLRSRTRFSYEKQGHHISLLMNDIEYLFIYLWNIWPLYIVFFRKRPVQIFCLFANWIVSFISIELQSFLYMLETSFYFFLSNTHLSIFSPSLWPAFSFSFLISMRFNLSFIFLFYFGIISKKSLLYPTS